MVKQLSPLKKEFLIKTYRAKYISFYNEMRPCYALGYDIPNHYEQRYWNGELEKKDTFRNCPPLLTGTKSSINPHEIVIKIQHYTHKIVIFM